MINRMKKRQSSRPLLAHSPSLLGTKLGKFSDSGLDKVCALCWAGEPLARDSKPHHPLHRFSQVPASDHGSTGLHLRGLAALPAGKSKHIASPGLVTFSRSGSSKPSANSLLSITEEAATSSGVDPLIDGEAEEGGKKERERDQQATPHWTETVVHTTGQVRAANTWNLVHSPVLLRGLPVLI